MVQIEDMTPREAGSHADGQARAQAAALIERLSIPVVCAPMFLVSGVALVREACRAGVIGAIPSANARDEFQFADWMDRLYAEVGDLPGKETPPGPIAANLNVRAGERIMTPRFEADLQTCRRHRAEIVITVNGDPTPVVDQVHDWGGLIFHDVTTIRHARRAAAAGVDGLVLVCGGGGGHSGVLNPFAFIPQVREFFDGIIILAGAIGTGRAVRAAQVMGADICYMGTRFIATQESMAGERYKQMLVEAQSADLIYTSVFSRGVPAMLLKSSIREAGFDPDNLPTREEVAAAKPRIWRDIWAAGQSVGVIEDIPPVAELVARLIAEYRA
jgi:nitronate monooxygenase